MKTIVVDSSVGEDSFVKDFLAEWIKHLDTLAINKAVHPD